MTTPSQPFPKEAIEAVARAMCRQANSEFFGISSNIDEVVERHWIKYQSQAIAALTEAAPFFAAERGAAIEAEREAKLALTPFALVAGLFDDIPGVYRCADDAPLSRKATALSSLSVGDLRRARSVLAKSEEGKL